MPLTIRRISLSYVLRLGLLLGVVTVSNNMNADTIAEEKNITEIPITRPSTKSSQEESLCPSNIDCLALGYPCISCRFNMSCVYGEELSISCKVAHHVNCIGNRTFEKTMICRFCYQTDPSEHICIQKANCNSVASPREYYRTNCSVKSDIICLGNRYFSKNLLCNWTGGFKWSTALFLSVTLGGFGADRFYLGHWQEGIGKLFSFGGLGVWTLVDVVLIWLHYLGPADGSLYI